MNRKPIGPSVFLALLLAASVVTVASGSPVNSNRHFITQIDPTGNANLPTFGSFNQHIAVIDGVYYAAYHDDAQFIRIVKSSDGGESWSNLYASGQHVGDSAPVIAADKRGRLHVFWSTHPDGRYMRFSGDPLTKDIDKTLGLSPDPPRRRLAAGFGAERALD